MEKNLSKILITTLLIVCIIGLNSCKKTESSTNGSTATNRGKIKTITTVNTNYYDSAVYTYDSYGRILTQEDFNSPLCTSPTSSNYSYSSGTATESCFDSGGNIISGYPIYYGLNSQGYISNSISNDGLNTATTINYNSLGQMISSTSSTPGIQYGTLTQTYTYTNGNLTSYTQSYYSNFNGTTQTTSNNIGTYLTTVDNRNINCYSGVFLCESLWGVGSVNLLSTGYTYQFNLQGQVIQQTRAANAANPATISTFTYY